MWTQRHDLAQNLPITDRVYSHADGATHSKVRVLRCPAGSSPEQERACRAFVMSASLCDEHGWALQDAGGLHLIAPAETLTILLQGLFEKSAGSGQPVDQLIEAEIDRVRIKLRDQTLAFKQALLLDAQYPDYVPAPLVIPA